MTATANANYRQLFATGLIALATLAVGAPDCGEPVLTRREERGRDLYGQMCAVCHGPNGEGYKADQATALANPGFLATTTDRFLKSAISDGRRNTTMSAWLSARGGPLSPADVDAVVAYLRTWGRPSPTPLDERAARGDPARGEEIFTRECVRCHGVHGTGGPFVHIGGPELLASATNGFLRDAIRNGRPPTTMGSYGASLGDAGIEDVVAALRGWQAAAGPLPNMPPVRPPPLPLGPVPLNPRGPDPVGFRLTPATTPADVIHAQLEHGARMALLDARTPSDYMAEHIKGAVSVPFYDPSPYLALLPRDSWLVCYCACPHAESGQLAQKLLGAGFTKVTVLDEGLGVWRMRKYGTERGAKP